MRTIIFLLAFIYIPITELMAQDENKIITDPVKGTDMLIGTVSREGLETLGDWFANEYRDYQADPDVIERLKMHCESYPYIFIVLGTWCGDSREQVPRFFRILDLLEYPESNVFMVAVDREKKAGEFCIGDFGIGLVPTFIFSQQGEETGRIIETPVVSLEQDFLDILNGRSLAPEIHTGDH
ncbi:MAG TPA: thioredoxin family protein [Lentimicrobium sp.]|jgi:hypothetical protein|nr:thioredoxin family protein [Lentimicrobium sp.]